MSIEYFLLTQKGGRDVNEDYVLSACEDERFLFALADGLGGHGGGEVASKTACESAAGEFAQSEIHGAALIAKCLETANDAVMQEQKKRSKPEQMKTTLVLFIIEGNKALWGHAGDSRLYMFRDTEIIAQTRDHSVPQMLADMGEISQSDIRNHEDRNRVLKVVGTSWEEDKTHYTIAPDEVALRDGDVFLLATDGFWELIDERQMLKLYRAKKSLEAWCESMEKAVIKAGRKKNMDNFSAIAIRYSRD